MEKFKKFGMDQKRKVLLREKWGKRRQSAFVEMGSLVRWPEESQKTEKKKKVMLIERPSHDGNPPMKRGFQLFAECTNKDDEMGHRHTIEKVSIGGRK